MGRKTDLFCSHQPRDIIYRLFVFFRLHDISLVPLQVRLFFFFFFFFCLFFSGIFFYGFSNLTPHTTREERCKLAEMMP